MALIPDDPKQRNALIGMLVVLAALYFFNDLWLSPKKEEITAMETRLESLESRNREAQRIAARGGQDLEERLAVFERHVLKLEELIPQSQEVPELLNDINVEARAAGVALTNLQPEPVEPGAFYTRESYQMDVVGDYHDIGRFLTAVASLRRIITPIDLELLVFQGQDSPVDADWPIVARFRILTYTLPESTAAALPAEGAGGPS